MLINRNSGLCIYYIDIVYRRNFYSKILQDFPLTRLTHGSIQLKVDRQRLFDLSPIKWQDLIGNVAEYQFFENAALMRSLHYVTYIVVKCGLISNKVVNYLNPELWFRDRNKGSIFNCSSPVHTYNTVVSLNVVKHSSVINN